MTELRHGEHFFESCRIESEALVHPEDRAAFLHVLDRDTLIKTLNRNGTHMFTYRLLCGQEYRYVNMKVTRMEDDERFVILGIMDVDEQIRQRREAERAIEEHAAYTRLSVLAGTFLSVYLVEPESGAYRKYSTTAGAELLEIPETGEDFFAMIRAKGRDFIDPADYPRFISLFTRESVLQETAHGGTFAVSLRLVIENRSAYYQLKAGRVEEKNGASLVIGFNNIDANVRREEEYARQLEKARMQANLDALTGVRNKYAYQEEEEKLNRQIRAHEVREFAVTVLDVNDLKKVNDTQGHQAGDQYLRDACRLICNIFKHSPVFRIGGDEFAVISQGADLTDIRELIGQVREHNRQAQASGGIVIACGMSAFGEDACVADVFMRADRQMYDNKKDLKSR